MFFPSDVCASPLILFHFPLVNILCGGGNGKMLLYGITLLLRCDNVGVSSEQAFNQTFSESSGWKLLIIKSLSRLCI